MSDTRMVWTDRRLEALRQYWAVDLTCPEIADLMQCTAASVRGAARLYGLPDRRRGRRASARLPVAAPPEKRTPPVVSPPGWPTKAQLMAGR